MMAAARTRQLDALAERYLDLCQDQLSALSADPAIAEMLARLIRETMAAQAAHATREAHAAREAQTARAGRDGDGRAGNSNRDTAVPGAGPAAAGAASGAREHDLDELARRIDELQKQLDALEGGSQPGG